MPLRVLQIVPGTSVDGPGLRTAIYFAGCTHGCPGCHNPASWAFDGGREMSVEQLMGIIRDNGFNVTFTGGDPLLHPDQGELLRLARAIRSEGLTIWCYTGYTIERVGELGQWRELLQEIDVVVDGPFIESRRTLSLPFRGSDNQRLVRAADMSVIG